MDGGLSTGNGLGIGGLETSGGLGGSGGLSGGPYNQKNAFPKGFNTSASAHPSGVSGATVVGLSIEAAHTLPVNNPNNFYKPLTTFAVEDDGSVTPADKGPGSQNYMYCSGSHVIWV